MKNTVLRYHYTLSDGSEMVYLVQAELGAAVTLASVKHDVIKRLEQGTSQRVTAIELAAQNDPLDILMLETNKT